MTFHIVVRKASEKRVGALLESKTNTDILFIGTSKVASAINPMLLWDHYGYSSCVLSAYKDGVRREWAMLRLALQYTTPKLVVLNPDKYWEYDEIDEQIAAYHEFVDAFPLSREKVDTTRKLYSDNMERLQILFPFSEYHARWKELVDEDFQSDLKEQAIRGSLGGTDVFVPKRFELIDRNEKEVPEGDGQEVIAQVIKECKDRGIDIMLLTLPADDDEMRQRYFNSLDDLAAQNGIEHINLVNQPDLINYGIDFQDKTHVNTSGAWKITNFLGQHISQAYDVPNHHGDATYEAEWGEEYEKYTAQKHKRLSATEDLHSLLLQCRDDTLNLVIYIADGSACFRDQLTLDLLQNVIDFHELKQAKENEEAYFAMIDYNSGILEEHRSLDATLERDLSFGHLRFILDEDKRPSLYVNAYDNNLFDVKGRGDIYIAVFDRWTGDCICTKAFKTSRVLNAECREFDE